jgi:carbonic anhydrase
MPGELFVHRNVANVVVHSDLNCLSVLQYAIEVLRIDHVIVCGHYGCGGIRAAFNRDSLGLIDNWLRHVQDIHDRHAQFMTSLPSEDAIDRLCELNVLEQARNVCQTTIVRDAWKSGQSLSIHAWIYALRDGLIRDLAFTASSVNEVATSYDRARAAIVPELSGG